MKLYWNSSRCSWTPNLPLQKGGTRRHYRLVLGRTGPFLSTTYTPPILDMMHSFEVQCTCATLAEARQSLSGSPLGGGYTPTHPPPPWWEPAQGPAFAPTSCNMPKGPSSLDIMHSFYVQCIHSILAEAMPTFLVRPWEAFIPLPPPPPPKSYPWEEYILGISRIDIKFFEMFFFWFH